MIRRLFAPFASAALLLASGCASFRPTASTSAAPPSLPREIGTSAGTAYTRAVQTAEDTFVRQTGRRLFRPSSGRGPEVELVAAIHIAEAGYYQRLQRHLEQADLVLYEGVMSRAQARMPAADRATAAAARSGPVRNPVYQRLAHSLGLTSQEFGIRLAEPRFRRCDMTFEDMAELLAAEAARGGEMKQQASKAKVDFQSMRGILSGQGWKTKLMFLALDHSATLRADSKLRVTLHNLNRDKTAQRNPRLTRLIIDDRNRHVMDELAALLAKPHKHRRIALFYGAGHMPGMEKLLREMGYRPAGPVAWMDAVTTHPASDGLRKKAIASIIEENE